jgi:hypothetical protein
MLVNQLSTHGDALSTQAGTLSLKAGALNIDNLLSELPPQL